MRIAPIIQRIKEANTRFGNYVAGSAEMDLAIRNTLRKDIAFVVPIEESCPANNTDSAIQQKITEKFSIIVAIANDTSDKDKTGFLAYDKLHKVRSELFRSIVGWQIKNAESIIYYTGGKFLTIQNDYLWWQYDFEYTIRLEEFDGFIDISGQSAPQLTDEVIEESTGEFYEKSQISQLDDFNYISSEYIMWPSANLPWSGDIPIDDTDITDMKTWIDLTDDPDAGGFGRGFGEGFDFYKILNRK
jgi:hypothetical protein